LVFTILVVGLFATGWLAYVARLERLKAEERTREIRRLALTLMNDVDAELQKLPGSLDVRTQLLFNTFKTLDNLRIPYPEPTFSAFGELISLFSTRSLSTQLLPSGWYSGGWNPAVFEIGVDRKMAHSGRASGHIFARASKKGDWATLFQTVRADDFRSKRVRLSAFLRSENVLGNAALWMQVHGFSGTLAFDGMNERLIRGTTGWRRYEIVLDVPQESTGISFGLMLQGGFPGQVRGGSAWIDDIELDIVTTEVPVTRSGSAPAEDSPRLHERPMNLDLEQ
jgi:hypothetical protein